MIEYDYTDSNSNVATTVTRTVNVVDTQAPVISLQGNFNETLEVFDMYTELGANWVDNYDGT